LFGRGSFQEVDHPAVFGPITKQAKTAFEPGEIVPMVAETLAAAGSRPRGPAFLDVSLEAMFTPGAFEVAAPVLATEDPLTGDVDEAMRLLSEAERPIVLLGSDVWLDGAEKAARDFVETQRVPVVMNGQGRGVVPSDHALAFNAARGAALAQADVIVIVGTPLDFRLKFGAFGETKVVHVVDHPSRIGAHANPAAAVAGPLTAALEALTSAKVRERDEWVAMLRAVEDTKRTSYEAELRSEQVPIHPVRVYGDLLPLLAPDTIVVIDAGDFGSYAGKYVDVLEPGGWLDPGPYGCLGTACGYALAAGTLYPGRRIVVLLGDGAAGFSMGDWDSLIRHGIDVTLVCGNNAAWGLEKLPMQNLFGYDVVADLRPETRYDEVMRALGGHGEFVRAPDELRPALERALATRGPSLVNVITDPSISYPRGQG
jgi:acetolactate synthase-1/2/3 large subunit